MNPLEFIRSKFGKKNMSSDIANSSLFGWTPVGGNSAYSHYKSNEYENAYASIKAIAARFQSILPYSIDANGKPVGSIAVDKLYHPNQQMSSVQFREALAVTTLVFDEINILVWHSEGGMPVPGGTITPKNIAGYTFLEGATRTSINGVVTFTVSIDGKQAKFTDKEVITITSGIDPYNLTKGMSPSRAARRWTRLDDYIADYQSGFFENGAVPAGQFIIEARTATEFQDIVANLKQKHQGSGQNNNVTYTPNIIDPDTGKGSGATIQWVPFNSANKDLALKDIFEQINKKIDSSFGVPASIRGVGENNNYATAQQDDKNFVINNIQPFALNIWSQFTHELNRITGGLGVAITFDLEIPTVADEDKTIAERRKIEADIILTMAEKGYNIDSIVDSFDLPVGYKQLKTGYKPPVITNDKPDVDDGREVLNSPNPTETAVTKAIDTKKLDPKTQKTDENILKDVIRKHMTDQIEDAVAKTKALSADKKHIAAFALDLERTIIPMLIKEGVIAQDEVEELLKAANLYEESLPEFILTHSQQTWYEDYLDKVASSFVGDTGNSIRQVLQISVDQGETTTEIRKRLRNILKTDEWRVERLAKSEINRMGGRASVYATENIQTQTGIKFMKVWNTSSAEPCEFCTNLKGTKVPVDGTFADVGDDIHGRDGGVLINDFVSMETAQAHPNCNCYTTYEVVR